MSRRVSRRASTAPSPVKPLEWWEEVQLDLLEALNGPHKLGLDVPSLRANPASWRQMRSQLRALKRPS